ncbi:MAG: hypothetical protein FJX77_14910 [Armatimonadetes bacterium]|nr:hypothetical protein [Armatimonadota bacterium]
MAGAEFRTTNTSASRSRAAHARSVDREIPWKVILVSLAVLVALGGGFWVKSAVDAQRPTGTDTEQLRTLLLSAERAAERRDPAGVVRWISEDYRDEIGLSGRAARYQVQNYLRSHRVQEVTIPSQGIQVQLAPDRRSARMSFPLLLDLESQAGRGQVQVSMTLTLQKDPVHYLWVFPGEEWRITRAEGYMPLVE